MHVIWSRAAQTRSVARHTTTSASRRRLRIGDLYTACYSTIVGTAVFADARVKEDRRKEWDRLIAEVKGEETHNTADMVDRPVIGTGMKENASWLPAIPLNGYGTAAGAIIPTASAWGDGYPASQKASRFAALITQSNQLDAHLQRSLSHITAESEDANSPSDTVDASDIGKWVDEEWPGSVLRAREPGRNSIYMKKVEEMIAKLVTQLLRTLKSHSPALAEGKTISIQMKEMAAQLEALHSRRCQVPDYSWSRSKDVRKERENLHRSLVTIFQKAESGQCPIYVMVAKICYNLLTTTAPPSIVTYNILVESFTRLQQYELGEVVVQSYFQDSKYKANSATARIFLDHYAARGDAVGFRHIMKRINAVDGYDMRVKRIPIDLLWMKQHRRWLLRSDVNFTHHGKYVHTKLPRNNTIFDAIIQGLLKLEGITSTIHYIQAAMQEGKLTSAAILHLVRKCVESQDVKSGRLVLYAILGHPSRRGFGTGAIKNVVDARGALYDLLHLCGIDISSYTSYTDKLIDIHPRRARALGQLLYHLRTKPIEQVIEGISELTLKLKRTLGITQHGQGQWSREQESIANHQLRNIDMALDMLSKYSSEHHHPSVQLVPQQNELSRVEKLVCLNRSVIERMQKKVFLIYYRRLPRHLQHKYHALPKPENLTEGHKLANVTYLYRRHQTKGLRNLIKKVSSLEHNIIAMQDEVASIYYRNLPLQQQVKFDTLPRRKTFLPKTRLKNIALLHQEVLVGDVQVSPGWLSELRCPIEQGYSFIRCIREEVSRIYYEKLPPQFQEKFTMSQSGVNNIAKAKLAKRNLAKIIRLHREAVLCKTKVRGQDVPTGTAVQRSENEVGRPGGSDVNGLWMGCGFQRSDDLVHGYHI